MSNGINVERERCARICEEFACMVDDGAGAVGRLWQAARDIRSGKEPLGIYNGRTEPMNPRDPDAEARTLREALEDAQRLLAHAGCPTGWIDEVLYAKAAYGVQPTREPLTDEQILAIAAQHNMGRVRIDVRGFARAVEAHVRDVPQRVAGAEQQSNGGGQRG